MSEHDNSASGVRPDPLFGGLTRPPTFLGLPVEVLLAIAGAATVTKTIATGEADRAMNMDLFARQLLALFEAVLQTP